MINNANQSLETALDKNNYNDEDLISIKKPTNLPYYNNTKDFTRAYGEVEMNGVFYKYVKCRIYNDSLEMLCTPNTSKQQLLNSKDNFTTVVFDLQKDTNKKSNNSNKSFSFKKLLSEFEKNNDFSLNFLLHAKTFLETESANATELANIRAGMPLCSAKFFKLSTYSFILPSGKVTASPTLQNASNDANS